MEDMFKVLKSSNDLSILNGLAFEEYLRQLFADLGYVAEKTQSSGDFGADLILLFQDKKSLFKQSSIQARLDLMRLKKFTLPERFMAQMKLG